MGVLRVKDGVEFATIAPGGFRILRVLDSIAGLSSDLIITSGTDGTHSGPLDPHHRGEAYDIRSHDLANKLGTLSLIQTQLGTAFFAFLEDPQTDNEHIHVQVRKGTTFP